MAHPHRVNDLLRAATTNQQRASQYPIRQTTELSPPRDQLIHAPEPRPRRRVAFENTRTLAMYRSDCHRQTQQIASYQEQVRNLTGNCMELQRRMDVKDTNHEREVLNLHRNVLALEHVENNLEGELVDVRSKYEYVMEQRGVKKVFQLLIWTILMALWSVIVRAWRWAHKGVTRFITGEREEGLVGQRGPIRVDELRDMR